MEAELALRDADLAVLHGVYRLGELGVERLARHRAQIAAPLGRAGIERMLLRQLTELRRVLARFGEDPVRLVLALHEDMADGTDFRDAVLVDALLVCRLHFRL